MQSTPEEAKKNLPKISPFDKQRAMLLAEEEAYYHQPVNQNLMDAFNAAEYPNQQPEQGGKRKRRTKRRKSLKKKRKTKRRLGGMNEPMARELKNRVYFLRRTRTRAREPEPVPESVEVFNMGELADALPINTRRKRGSYKQNSRKKRNTSQKDSKTPTSSRKRSKSLGGRRTKRRRQ